VKDVCLIAAEIDWGDPLPESPRSGESDHIVQVTHGAGLQITDQGIELLAPVFHRGAGHEENTFGGTGDRRERLRALRGRILHIMSFVGDHNSRKARGRQVQGPQRIIGCQSDAAVPRPLLQSRIPILTVQADRGKVAEFCDLVFPICQNAGGRDHENMRGAGALQVGDEGQRLNGFARPISSPKMVLRCTTANLAPKTW